MNRKVLFVQVAAVHLLVLGLLFGLMNCCERKRQADYAAPPAVSRPPLVEPGETIRPKEVEEVRGRKEMGGVVEKEEPLVIEEYGKPGLVKESEMPRSEEPAAGPVEHEVVKGETLSGIAEKYGVTLREIMELNSIQDPGKIRVGQAITIPGE